MRVGLYPSKYGTCTYRYFGIPYVGYFSRIAQCKIDRLVKHYCTNLRVVLTFKSLKLSSLFSTKDKTPIALRSRVVYKFVCAGCGSSYIGETCRHLKTRAKEHFGADMSSHINEHLQRSNHCYAECSFNKCFSVIDQAQSGKELKIRESLHINWVKPALNKQLAHTRLSLCL